MSRSKLKSSANNCADCGSVDPSWASLNRGILLCTQCCSVHRSMGRHISHVKSLRHGSWPPFLLAMVNTLTAQNVNSIWEHSLLDPSAPKQLRRKPQPKDSLHPTKSEFIQAKHRRLAYVFRPRRDDVPCTLNELSRQLHSSVRSANLDTSLRLLVQGADPNYFNEEKGTSCLHVACRAGHSAQAELLVAWGADPNTKDTAGNTPSASAKLGGHVELANRMVELVYEVTDRLAYYLTNKKPDHMNGQHYINLDQMDQHEMTDVAKAARGKLQLLPNHLFEELVMDIYDEIDRRECEAVWNTSAIGLERFGVAFLPVNPALSAPRNQGRQKLARLSPGEMAALLRDVLMDATRRQHIATLKPYGMATSISNAKTISRLSDDEPLYDSVASDDDYAALLPVPPNDVKDLHNSPKSGETVSKLYEASIPVEQSSATNNQRNAIPSKADDSFNDLNIYKEVESLKEQINSKDSLIVDLRSELQSLQKNVENLKNENILLRNLIEKNTAKYSVERNTNINSSHKTDLEKSAVNDASVAESLGDSQKMSRNCQRPNSMYETREGLKQNWQITKHQLTTVGGLERVLGQSVSVVNEGPESPALLPSAKQVHKHADVLTKCIQGLWLAMQDHSAFGHTFVLKAQSINDAAYRLVAIFPLKCEDAHIHTLVTQITSSCGNLVKACGQWKSHNTTEENTNAMLCMQSAAYDLAKSNKLLLTNFLLEAEE